MKSLSDQKSEMKWCLNGVLNYVALGLLCLIASSSACFITNCPLGGKRSIGDIQIPKPQRQCLPCGPQGLGQCVGPNICCGPLIGCQIKTSDSKTCERENDIPTPCEIEGKPCGNSNHGNCVANGLCCTEHGCEIDDSCELDINFRTAKRRTPELLTYIKRLLDTERLLGRK